MKNLYLLVFLSLISSSAHTTVETVSILSVRFSAGDNSCSAEAWINIEEPAEYYPTGIGYGVSASELGSKFKFQDCDRCNFMDILVNSTYGVKLSDHTIRRMVVKFRKENVCDVTYYPVDGNSKSSSCDYSKHNKASGLYCSAIGLEVNKHENKVPIVKNTARFDECKVGLTDWLLKLEF